jgi:hypothetical protein
MKFTQEEYYREVAKARNTHPEWRVGQRFFNVLHDMDPELANMIRGTLADPFYNENRIPLFEQALWG